MPINQDRLLALLAAAEDFQSALDRACSLVSAESRRCCDSPEVAASALSTLAMMLTPDHLITDSTSQTVLAVERERTRPSRLRRNEREKLRARSRRLAARQTQQGDNS